MDTTLLWEIKHDVNSDDVLAEADTDSMIDEILLEQLFNQIQEDLNDKCKSGDQTIKWK